MSPKIVDKEQRKHDIALSALEIFSEKGFESASISRIAKAAGIGKGTVYEYFGSKEELIHAAFLAWTDRMRRMAEEAILNVEDPVERLRTLVRSLIGNFVSDERTTRIVIAVFESLLVGGKELFRHDTIREAFSERRKVISRILLEGVSRGAFRPEIARDAEKIAINLAAYLDGIALHHLTSRETFDLGQQVDFYLEELLESLSAR